MAFKVVFRASAERDLTNLYRYIRDANGDPRPAGEYVRRIREYCEGFADLPERGTRRDDLKAGLRTVGFEGRATVVFRIEGNTVRILRILYGGRNLTRRTPHL